LHWVLLIPQSLNGLEASHLELKQDIFSLLYNSQLLCSWRLPPNIVVEVVLRSFSRIAPSRTLTRNSLRLFICPNNEMSLFFFKIWKLYWLIHTSMRLASLDENICIRRTLYQLAYILDIFFHFVYNGLHYVKQSDTDATRVWNCDVNTCPWGTGGFTVCCGPLKTFCIAAILKSSFLKRSVSRKKATVNFRRISFTLYYTILISPVFIVKY